MSKFYLTIVLAVMALCAAAQGDRFECDDSCTPNDGKARFSVVSPVGNSTIEPIKMAPRLTTLAGKTIAVVGEDFMANVTHPEIKRLILEKYPTARVILPDELPIAGPYPAPGIVRASVEEFRQNLIDMKVDAVIAGNGGCGICTPKETGSCIVAEMLGIPSVIVTAPGFDEEARYTARNNGVPVLRVALYPGAFATHTDEQLIRNTREITWPQIEKALATPIGADEYVTTTVQEGITNDVFRGTLEEVYAHFKSMQWADGAPFVPPTYDKVLEYLKYTDYAWDETIAILPAAHRNSTTWHVAVNACMAGCKPEYMPILIAMTKAMGGANFRRTLASTHAWVPYSWLNGPVARQLGISSAQGEINAEANTALSRFMKYAMTNLAGYYIGQSRMGTFGYLEPWCLVEDEQACHRVGWATWQEQQGFSVNDNTITCASALMWGNNMAPSTLDPEKTMQLLAWDIADRGQFALGSGKQFTNRVVLMTEPVAATLAKGYPTLDILESTLIENSRRPARERAFANYYANPGSRKDDESHTFNQYYSHICKDELAEETYTPEWYDTPQGTIVTVPTMEPGATAFLITGDASRNKIQTMPGGGFTVEQIELPRNWDALAADLGYEPLSKFFLASDGIVTSAPQPTATGQQRPQRRYNGTYNVAGQRMNRPQGRGFFIRDGRKYIQ